MVHVTSSRRPASSRARRVLGAGSEAVGRRLAGGRLRVLAYHRVTDPEAFERQLRFLTTAYHPVAATDVVAAAREQRPLPRRAVWVTFDDGYADTVASAPLLERFGIRATMFACPAAALGTSLWFERAQAAIAAGWRPETGPADGRADADVLRWLKRLPDDERRATVDTMPAAPVPTPFATAADLHAWVAAGHHVGNHSWDHPCLDRCDADEQRRQVAQARSWIDDELPGQPRVFAYPNGNWSPAAADAVRAAGEELALLFDHRLARAGRVEVSRLMADTATDVARLRLVLSGVHGPAVRLLRRRR
jgi:peptidoglycan/xylan/chitin deacetylase (PgdA/CDA1 family)